ncbi:MAG: DUF4188 domain-containing protein [Armatimonadetes bacterium]|nr:DUF4188 domain-containing protein [Anaerolineae bacterium]
MPPVLPGRFTAQSDEPFVVFLIGMRVNSPLVIHKWLPVMLSMVPMMNELQRHPDKGMISSRYYLSGRVILLVQYWRTFEQLEAFARNPNDPHLPAWQRFNQKIAKSGVVGVFHETYRVEQGNYETVYSDMPVFGLALATQHVPVTGRRETARRLSGETEPAVSEGMQT